MKYLIILLCLLTSATLFAQGNLRVRGTVRSSDNKNLAGASVILKYEGSKDSLKTATTDKGVFTFGNVGEGKVLIN